MIRWLLDTNAIIALLKGKFPRFTSRVMAEKPETFGLSVIVYHELIYGAAKSARPEQNMQLIDAIAFPLLAFEPKDASAAGLIRGQLAKLGTPIGPLDVLIAGQALARGLVLITDNSREFSRIPDLKQENWLR
jgi:tRNA(fMet)-specific endonuclease VapC